MTELTYTTNPPTKEGCYWMKCDENGQAPEWVSVYWSGKGKKRELLCDWEHGSRYPVSMVHNNLSDVTWACAIIVNEATVEVSATLLDVANEAFAGSKSMTAKERQLFQEFSGRHAKRIKPANT